MLAHNSQFTLETSLSGVPVIIDKHNPLKTWSIKVFTYGQNIELEHYKKYNLNLQIKYIANNLINIS